VDNFVVVVVCSPPDPDPDPEPEPEPEPVEDCWAAEPVAVAVTGQTVV